MLKEYTEQKVLDSLTSNKTVTVSGNVLTLTDLPGKNSWGKLDFLVSKCGYVITRAIRAR